MTRPKGQVLAASETIPSPDSLTSPRSASQTFSSQSLNTKNSSNSLHALHRSSINAQSSSNLDLGTTQQPLEEASETPPITRLFDWDIHATFQRSARYYGPTSFTAVFNENTNLIENLQIGDDRRKHPSTWPFGQPLLGKERPSAPTVRMNEIVKALWNIPSKEICMKLLATYNTLHHGTMNYLMISHCIETFWVTFGSALAVPRTSEKLSTIADILFKNEERPLPPAPEDGIAWINSFMGPNLRFEMLGILFSFFGMSYQILQDWDELFLVPENFGRDRKDTTWRMKECADVCVKMCEISEENNEISIALTLCVATLESVCIGDECFQTRRRVGDAIVCSIAAGLHRMPEYGPNNRVTAASEFKRRVFSAVYCSDKSHAALNGTPPTVSSKFCIVRLPLDIGEEDLFLPLDKLDEVVSKLDANGWNTTRNTYRCTYHRAYKLLAEVQEDILEASLSVDANVPVSKINDLHRRCQESYDSLPDKVLYYEYGTTTPKQTRGEELVNQAYLFLNMLQNRFLIDRLAIARGINNEQRLLNTALEMMDLTTMFWIKRDQLMKFSSAFDWIVTCYGIPCAGVICVELLKQATGQSILQFSRSEAVQKLTMFIGFLEWIRPTDGNYMLAGRLKKVVGRILDRVLEPPKEFPGHDMLEIPIDPMLAPFGEMDWLNTLDWTQGSWMEFN